ncbi:ribonuclease E/G [Parerythrobacter aestuarii]|uniref:ribonuclease E/G n=1 Tax=Parerythrobacter aestuarii TaxID=3020909 RepID=UPI0024DE7231|nr:ribonuclease E/G [Parerythrobacter aestuarii]
MAEWHVVEGIGEHRAVLCGEGSYFAAKIDWPGELSPGQVIEGVLVHHPRNSSRGRARFPSGEEALVDYLPRDASEGATLRFRITRAAIAEAGRNKLAHARVTDEAVRPAPTLAERLGAKVVNGFYRDTWAEIWSGAWDSDWPFAGGSLTITPTPAMTLIDVDGELPPRELALAAVESVASAIALLDLSGSIGIDFPTLPSKADRRQVDNALADALADWDHERTAMNGFGFVQLVSRLERPSLLHRIQFDRAGASARYLLLRAEETAGPGAIEITAHPAVLAKIRPEWEEEFLRRRGVPLRLRADPGIALGAGNVQAVPL